MNKENEDKLILALAGILSATDELATQVAMLKVTISNSLAKIEKAIKKIDSGVI